MATSADKPDFVLSVAVLWGLVGCSGDVMADGDDEVPDMEFLEYLGSWEESDEDWLLFEQPAIEAMAAEGKKRSDRAPKSKESTESEDET